jgi:hypothetical protein
MDESKIDNDREAFKKVAATLISDWPSVKDERESAWLLDITNRLSVTRGGNFRLSDHDALVKDFEHSLYNRIPWDEFPAGLEEELNARKNMPSRFFEDHGIGKPNTWDMMTYIAYVAKVVHRGLKVVLEPRTGESKEVIDEIYDRINRRYFSGLLEELTKILETYPAEGTNEV